MAATDVYGMPFEGFVEKYRGLVFNRAYSILRDIGEAEDVVQETFINLHERSHTFRQGERVEPWIYKIATNKALDNYRKRKRSALTYAEDIDPWAKRLGRNPEDEYVTTIDAIKFLDTLPSGKRQMLVLQYNGFTYEEIAEIMGISPGYARFKLGKLRREAMNSLRHGHTLDLKRVNASLRKAKLS
jgi:RNA polymerase sigma-70 factor (ECF subfamily)